MQRNKYCNVEQLEQYRIIQHNYATMYPNKKYKNISQFTL